MAEEKKIATGYIGNALRSAADNHTTTFADEIFDTERQKYQNEVNTDFETTDNEIKADLEAEKAAIMGTDRIADGAITTKKVADAAVTYDKLQPEIKEVVENIKYIKHPKFVRCVTDNNDKILWWIWKDGRIDWAKGVPTPIQEELKKLEQLIRNNTEGDENVVARVVANESAITTINNEFSKYKIEVADALDKKMDGVILPHPKFIHIITDAEERILIAIDKNGKPYYAAGVPEQIMDLFNEVYDTFGRYKKHPAFIKMVTDANGRIICGAKKDGKTFIGELENEQFSNLQNSTEAINVEVTNIKADVIDVKKDIETIRGNTPDVLKGFEIPYRRFGAMTTLTVKKDGSGDFTSIQEAINSISDATAIKQYDIQVYDDFVIEDLKELYLVSSPQVKNTLDSPTSFVALVITKDWVHVRGIGAKKKLSIISPNVDMDGSCFKNIQTIYPMGNSSIENFEVSIKGGRYAIHQESGGSKTSLDYHATTLYKDLKVIHYGNSMYTNGSSWGSCMAQANGTTSGLRQVYINVEWISYENTIPFYSHTNNTFDLPNEFVFIQCSARMYTGDQTKVRTYIADRYSCQNNRVIMINSDMKSFTSRYMGYGTINDNSGTHPQIAFTKDFIFSDLVGYGNKPMRIPYLTANVLRITSTNVGNEIAVKGGSAKDIIFGNVLYQKNASDINGVIAGTRLILQGTYSHIHDLPYLLGNCAAEPKHLILEVGGVEVDVIFNKNYMTADGSEYDYSTTPNMSTSDILAELNNTYSDYCKFANTTEAFDTFSDCKEIGYNYGTSSIPSKKLLVRDYAGYDGWRIANEGEKAQGFSLETITPNSYGKVALLKKNTFSREVCSIWSSMTAGTLYKAGENGSVVATTEREKAILVALGAETLGYYK